MALCNSHRRKQERRTVRLLLHRRSPVLVPPALGGRANDRLRPCVNPDLARPIAFCRVAQDELTTDEFARWWRETGERELGQLLLWRWDPIGVADDFPYTAGEYDDYAPQIAQKLRAGADGKAVADHLRTVERDAMDGPFTRRKRLDYLASLLRQWYENSQASWREFGPLRR